MSPALALRLARRRKIAKERRKERIAVAWTFLDIASRNLAHARMWCRDNPGVIAGAEALVKEEAELLAKEMRS